MSAHYDPGSSVLANPKEEVLAALCDDLNTPKALGILWTTLRSPNVTIDAKREIAKFADQVLSLGLFDSSRLAKAEPKSSLMLGGQLTAVLIQKGAPESVKILAEQRWAARLAKNFAESDRLRDAIVREGYVMRDRRDGYDLVRAGS